MVQRCTCVGLCKPLSLPSPLSLTLVNCLACLCWHHDHLVIGQLDIWHRLLELIAGGGEVHHLRMDGGVEGGEDACPSPVHLVEEACVH